jgi:CelD/BcsL family acetyltransferase involved in cellulose biosynthesis
MRINIIDPTTEPRWDEFLDNQPNALVFHTSAWARVIMEVYGYIPRYLVMEDTEGKYIAGLPLFLIRSRLTGTRLVCLPFSDYCYPLANDANNLIPLLEKAKEEMTDQGASYLEIRGWHSGEPPANLEFTPFRYHLTHCLDLKPGIDVLERNLHTNARRSVRKASKENITLRTAETEEDLKRFYKLNVITRKKNRVLPQPYSFFQSLFRHLVPEGMANIMMAEWEGKLITAGFFLTYKDTVLYKYSASDSRYIHKCANHLVIWETIKQACDSGCRLLDFGRCSPENEGLRAFKKRWSADESEYPYYFYPSISGVPTLMGDNLRYKIMNVFTMLMPSFASEAIGSILFKHMG